MEHGITEFAEDIRWRVEKSLEDKYFYPEIDGDRSVRLVDCSFRGNSTTERATVSMCFSTRGIVVVQYYNISTSSSSGFNTDEFRQATAEQVVGEFLEKLEARENAFKNW